MARPEVLKFSVLAALLFAGVCRADVPTAARQALRTGDYPGAWQILEPLADNGEADALYQLGRLQEQGLGVAPDAERALDYYRRAAELGHAEAAYLLGEAHMKGRGAVQDDAAARRWYAKAAAAGVARAETRLVQLDASAPRAVLSDPVASLRGYLSGCDRAGIQAVCRDARDEPEKGAALVRDSLFDAVSCDDPDLLETLLDCGADPAARDSAGNTPLHRAIGENAPASAGYLLTHGGSRAAQNASGWSPRMLAERSSNTQIRRLFGVTEPERVKSLQMVRAATDSAAHQGWSPLAVAAWQGESALVRQLLGSGADVNEVDASGRTALYRAVTKERTGTAAILLDAGARADDPDILDQAVALGQVSLLEALLRHGAVAVPVSRDRPSALQIAVREDRPEAAAELLRLGADPDVGFRDLTPLMLAAREGRTEIVDQLLGAGASLGREDASGCSALCWALRSRQEIAAGRLVAAGAPNTTDARGESTVMLAAAAGYLDCVETLVDRLDRDGDPINAQSESGSHALLAAAAGGHARVAEVLLDHGAEVGLTNLAGDTALIVAVRGDHKDVAALLLERGANAHARNAKFESARSIADAKDDDWSDVFAGETGLWRLLSGNS
jgi:ankyrin repeat protein